MARTVFDYMARLSYTYFGLIVESNRRLVRADFLLHSKRFFDYVDNL